MYETDIGRLKMAVPFLAEGLRQKDVCIVVPSADTRDQILTGLSHVVGDLADAQSARQLITSLGEPSGDQMYAFLASEFITATCCHNTGIRVVGDMAWSLDRGIGPAELREFETRFDQNLAHTYPVISLCQYDALRFSGVGMFNALKSHRDTFDFPMSRFLTN
jgi:hypothetical protein